MATPVKAFRAGGGLKSVLLPLGCKTEALDRICSPLLPVFCSGWLRSHFFSKSGQKVKLRPMSSLFTSMSMTLSSKFLVNIVLKLGVDFESFSCE